MPLAISARVRRLVYRLLLVATLAVAIGCGEPGNSPQNPAFTDDELYFIDIYTRIREAKSYYPTQPVVAESLFAFLEFSVDSLRIADTIANLNRTPERWIAVLTEIEDRIRRSALGPASER